jgi:hypothetical protein
MTCVEAFHFEPYTVNIEDPHHAFVKAWQIL